MKTVSYRKKYTLKLRQIYLTIKYFEGGWKNEWCVSAVSKLDGLWNFILMVNKRKDQPTSIESVKFRLITERNLIEVGLDFLIFWILFNKVKITFSNGTTDGVQCTD